MRRKCRSTRRRRRGGGGDENEMSKRWTNKLKNINEEFNKKLQQSKNDQMSSVLADINQRKNNQTTPKSDRKSALSWKSNRKSAFLHKSARKSASSYKTARRSRTSIYTTARDIIRSMM